MTDATPKEKAADSTNRQLQILDAIAAPHPGDDSTTPDTQGADHETGRATSSYQRIDLEELQQRVNLPQLIENDTTLTYKSGKGEYRGTCPFHQGKNPTAFCVFPIEFGWGWKCHACGEGGNAIEYVKKSENISDFLEAVRWLADWAPHSL